MSTTKSESFAESLRESKESDGNPEQINEVPGVRNAAAVLERDDRENPEGPSPTNWSRYGSGTEDLGKSAE